MASSASVSSASPLSSSSTSSSAAPSRQVLCTACDPRAWKTTRYCPQCFRSLDQTSHVHMVIDYDNYQHARPWKLDGTYACCSYSCLMGYARFKYQKNNNLYMTMLMKYMLHERPPADHRLPIAYPGLELQSRYTHASGTPAASSSSIAFEATHEWIQDALRKRQALSLETKLHYELPVSASLSSPSIAVSVSPSTSTSSASTPNASTHTAKTDLTDVSAL